jgi:hypothetical protein
LKENGRMELKYFGFMDCRGKFTKTANFVMKEMLETGYGKDYKNAQKQLNL